MNQLLNSLYTNQHLLSDKEIAEWIFQRNSEVQVNIRETSFNKLKKWKIDPYSSNLVHESGRFFSIEGIRVKTDYGVVPEWSQPIINQPEIGFLGIISKEIDGVLYFLMQAKIEPGNVNCVQLSPTLQATKSNYSRIHKGKSPAYLEYFRDAKPEHILLDQLQSEQGARFLRKRNRNIIIKVTDDIPVYDNFCWMTVGQLKQLMLVDNLVNMDTRTVLSGILWGELMKTEMENSVDFSAFADAHTLSSFGKEMIYSSLKINGLHSINHILSWLSRLKSEYDLFVDRIPLKDVKEWELSEREIVRHDRRFFRIIGVDITIDNREVSAWSQPLVQPMQEGVCAFIIKKIDGIYHFLVQAKLECGNFDIFELAPTVQCLTGGYTGLSVMPLFLNYVLNASPEQIIFNTLQSEEGGRFFREQNRNVLIVAGDDFGYSIPNNYAWMTLGQLNQFLKFNNYLNIQARSLLSLLNFK
jgi:oxidase EvaA